MNILYASDNHYADILGISILSLLENNRECDDIKVSIINDEISDENIRNIESIFKKYGREFPIFKKVRSIQEVLHMDVYEDRFSRTQFARLFLEDIVDENEDRILYMDCDVIVNGSLKDLWNMELNGKVGAALADAFSSLYRGNIGLQPNDLMFNSGVMLIDMKQWRKQHIGHQLRAFIRSHRGMVQQGVQGVLNAILSSKMQVFSPRYNLVTNYAAFEYEDMLVYRKPTSIYSKKEIEKAKDDPCIVHYTSSFLVARPWEEGKEHPYKYLWNRYHEMSPWKEEIRKEKRMKKWKRIYVIMMEHIPYRMNLYCSGILQAYVRPLYGKWKYGKLYDEASTYGILTGFGRGVQERKIIRFIPKDDYAARKVVA